MRAPVILAALLAALSPLLALGQQNVTEDGTCGAPGGFTCRGSEFGNCCSEHGWCGSTPDHCDVGCQALFGVCNDLPPPPGGLTTIRPRPPPPANFYGQRGRDGHDVSDQDDYDTNLDHTYLYGDQYPDALGHGHIHENTSALLDFHCIVDASPFSHFDDLKHGYELCSGHLNLDNKSDFRDPHDDYANIYYYVVGLGNGNRHANFHTDPEDDNYQYGSRDPDDFSYDKLNEPYLHDKNADGVGYFDVHSPSDSDAQLNEPYLHDKNADGIGYFDGHNRARNVHGYYQQHKPPPRDGNPDRDPDPDPDPDPDTDTDTDTNGSGHRHKHGPHHGDGDGDGDAQTRRDVHGLRDAGPDRRAQRHGRGQQHEPRLGDGHGDGHAQPDRQPDLARVPDADGHEHGRGLRDGHDRRGAVDGVDGLGAAVLAVRRDQLPGPHGLHAAGYVREAERLFLSVPMSMRGERGGRGWGVYRD
ncbi:uncharacterized protein E0L32_010604 [Thyridium curvatum]|uniref:Chitin-binding type-1 domain-containing protein n=1 Tax=Thyridium curvatum TaxID=1093900 RepID=A0A507AS64_9PEZI|nr:uncharacterized protein E0L32_010604 [Thyridium curvatum]TPX07708.1 hypothetical protein E0L32_010604 [Thyridium curvatum]